MGEKLLKAEIIAVGTELLLGQIANTNAQYLSSKLAEFGINVYYHASVGDNESRILDTLQIATSRSEIVIITGGLGPTNDDLTKETVAKFLNLPLEVDKHSLSKIRDFFDKRSIIMSANNQKQAYIIKGSLALANNNGTAPGIYLEFNNKIFILLPGPPKELQPMFENEALPIIKKNILKDENVILSETLRFLGIGESALEQKIADIIKVQTNPTIAPLCGDYEVTIRITAKAATKHAAMDLILPVKNEIIARCKDYYYGDNNDTLTSILHKYLLLNNYTISVAESCTGGLLSHKLTSLPGSSNYFLEGLVCYSNEAKIRLGVKSDTLIKHGAVSEDTAIQMAEMVKSRSKADIAISITGVAGPGGGTSKKPVGLAYIGISNCDTTYVRKFNFYGNRNEICLRTVNQALFLLIKHIEG